MQSLNTDVVERFPRVGGDRPKRLRRDPVPRVGSPAWAGIDPFLIGYSPAVSGFPRVGGDRPQKELAEIRRGKVPPRGRG